MAAKKPAKSRNDNKGTKAQVAAFKNSKTKFKPTEAITAKGQKAKGLSKSKVKDRYASTAKTKVKQTGGLFSTAGSGGSLSQGIGLSNPSVKKALYEGGQWVVPYGKAFKGINLATKGIKAAKTAKTVRGVAKTATFFAGGEAYEKATGAAGLKKSNTRTKTRTRPRGK